MNLALFFQHLGVNITGADAIKQMHLPINMDHDSWWQVKWTDNMYAEDAISNIALKVKSLVPADAEWVKVEPPQEVEWRPEVVRRAIVCKTHGIFARYSVWHSADGDIHSIDVYIVKEEP